MFTGIVEEIGKVERITKNVQCQLTIRADTVLEDVNLGDSIAVNGICLTVIKFDKKTFTVDVMRETFQRTSLDTLHTNSFVNLERALPANGRFGGHIVTGHIDGTGKIKNITRDNNAVWYKIKANPSILKFIVEKGSITIDGTSLTVAKVSELDFSVSVIPHTLSNTILKNKKIGDIVNLENDIIGKYVEALVTKKTAWDLSEKILLENGF